MFKDLYRKLTITNALILITFLLIFSYSIVGFSNAAFDASAKNALTGRLNKIIEIVLRYNSLEFTLNDETTKPEYNERTHIDYIIWDKNLKLVNLSTIQEDLVSKAYQNALEVSKTKGSSYNTVNISGAKYRLYTVYFRMANGDGVVAQVYQSREIDDLIIRQLFLVIMAIGTFSAVILIFISSHLAKKSLEPVRKSYESQKEFIADASHELRTPLTIIKTTAELLSMKENETIGENEKWLNNIQSETENMSRLIQSLLTLAQADNNQIPVKTEPVNLSELIKDLCGKFELVAREKEIAFDSIISENVQVIGDKDKLNQLLVILLDNAMKYTPEKGTITATLMHTSDKAVITVKDSGMGVKDEDKKRIFERFYRVDKARSREQGGAGLGLSIANWIVREHKGKIWVESEENKGSSFIVELPKKRKI
ncbi:MAG: cell wall metabolism sensor histidine kinase WalK [Eubacteriaceae bacterium]|nr:cell wall metabolism sensor histidine kinase WalK [Eubacteriaceae bacterium]